MSARNRDRLRIAVQKSGRLADASMQLMARCGLSFRLSRDRLFCYGETLGVDLLLVRDDDIPGLIAGGVCDLGFVGRNVALEAKLELRAQGVDEDLTELRGLGFGQCRLSLAVPQDWSWTGPAQLEGLRIATSYPRLVADWLARHGVRAEPVMLAGSVEIAPRLGTADVICDLVSTGATLAANQLKEVEVLLHSEAILLGSSREYGDERQDLLELLLRRIDGVMRVRESKLLMLHAPRAALDTIMALLPEAERPTVVPLAGSADEVSVHVVCRQALGWKHLEDMKAAGASGMLVLPVEQMLP